MCSFVKLYGVVVRNYSIKIWLQKGIQATNISEFFKAIQKLDSEYDTIEFVVFHYHE